jgi:hypothetical protein
LKIILKFFKLIEDSFEILSGYKILVFRTTRFSFRSLLQIKMVTISDETKKTFINFFKQSFYKAGIGLKDYHENSIISFLRFARTQRALNLRTVQSAFEDIQSAR